MSDITMLAGTLDETDMEALLDRYKNFLMNDRKIPRKQENKFLNNRRINRLLTIQKTFRLDESPRVGEKLRPAKMCLFYRYRY